MGRLLIVTSGKGGVGKSTASTGLAIALSNCQKRVLLVDADEGLRCLDLMLSVSERLVFDLADVLSGNVDISGATQKIDKYDNLFLLAAPAHENSVDGEQFGSLMAKCIDEFDFVIVDCPAGLNTKYYHWLPKRAEFIVVTNVEPVSLRGGNKIASVLRDEGYENLRLIFNRFSIAQLKQCKVNIDGAVDLTGVQLLGIVPEDSCISKASAMNEIAENGRSVMAFYRIASRLNGGEVPLPSIQKI